MSLSTRDRRVMLVSHYFPPHLGGIENVVAQQARHLAEAGADVLVMTTGPQDEIETLDDGVRVMRVSAWNGAEHRAGIPFPVPGPQLLLHLWRWARWADVIHVHDGAYLTSWAASLAAAIRRRPLVMTQHVALVDHPAALVRRVQRLVWSLVGRRLLRRAEQVFVLNDQVSDFVVAHGARPSRIHHLPNGVDAEMFTPCTDRAERDAIRARLSLPADRMLVLFAGRLVPKKGYDVLRTAADPAYDLVFAGDGHHGMPAPAPGVHHLGRLTAAEMAQVYRACDVFALPSTSEGFPLSVQEAMACGLPVLTTDDPGYAAYRLDRRAVRLLPRDSGAYRAELRALAADPHLRERMGEWSRAFAVESFSWTRHAAELLRRYPVPEEVA